jgi:hypothetical protein
MSARGGRVERPVKTTEFRIEFGTREAASGWRDLLATKRNALVAAWDALTADPLRNDPTCHQLKGRLALVERGGVEHAQRQYELPGGARLWYFVLEPERRVVVIRAFTAHPNQTK